MKRLLIVTYYWPPSGGPGVQRVLKFVKYLPQYGWQPIILTVRDGEFPVLDPTLENEIPTECAVYRSTSWEPTRLYKKFTGKEADKPLPVAVVAAEKKNWKESLAAWLRMAFFIPDAKIGWMPFAVYAGKKLIRQLKPDAILSSSPPPTVHLIARRLARYGKIPWIADFRDPWTRIYHYHGVKKPLLRQWLDRHLEKRVVTEATVPVTVSGGFSHIIGPEGSSHRFRIIPNGYDFDIAESVSPNINHDKFVVLHSGKLVDAQNAPVLWRALAELCQVEPEFRKKLEIRFVGKVSDGILRSIEQHGLAEVVSCPGYLPHDQIPAMLRQAALQLLIIPNTGQNSGIVPGKLFEYLGSLKPVLSIGPPDSDVGKILEITRGGAIFDFDDQVLPDLKQYLLNVFRGQFPEINREAVLQFHRRRLTGQLVQLIEEAISS